MADTTATGDGWAVAHLDDLGDGPGFRKIRARLGVTAFGVNAVVLPPGTDSRRHFHDRQEELYFVHAGRVAFEFGDGAVRELGPGGLARVDAATVRCVHNIGEEEDAVYLCVGGEGGYVGRDGRAPDDG